MTEIVVDDVSVAYETGTGEILACSSINTKIESGEFVTIIGPSGCGKSTLLHSIGGLQTPSSGTITLGGERFRSPDPHRAAFVFQDYTLFPWKTVLANAAIGLQFSGVPRVKALARAAEELEFVGLSEFAHSYPRELSGGMQQRVAIARALAMDPAALLMDEPFGALDEQTRRALGAEMARILEGRSVVLITHSLDEAIFWADRIIVMSPRPGTIIDEIDIQAARPRDLSFMTTVEFTETRLRLFELVQLGGEPALGNRSSR